jgi:Fic family protein
MKIPKEPPDIKKILSNKDMRKELLSYLEREDVNKYINQMNQRYLYWDEFTYRPRPKKTKKDLLWALIKFTRNLDIDTIELSKIKNFKFKYKVLPRFLEKLHEFDLNMGGTMASSSIVPDEEKERFLISSLMEEAIASSQLEGAATTRKVAKDMLRTSRKPRNKSELMILNNYMTIKKIIEMIDKKITPKLILDIHASITKDTLRDSAFEGRFRDTNEVAVVDPTSGLVYYKPPDYKHINQLVKDLCAFINNDSPKRFMHPIIKASIIHFFIGYIHPFIDGNGRTARAIFYWYLLSKGYWLMEFMSISRTIVKSPMKYARAYLHTELDENDMTYFIKFQIRTLDIALKELKDYIKRKIQEKEWIYEFIQIEGLNHRQVEIIKRFYGNPKLAITINEVKNMFDVVYQTARMDLLQLESMGYLKKHRLGKKKLIFLRSPAFRRLIEQKDISL